MHTDLQDIQVLIAHEVKALASYVHHRLQGQGSLLAQLTNYLFKYKGKELRPRLVFLTAGASGGITEKTRRGAALVTLLHHASLVHDDVVDEAIQRRGVQSVNARWGNKAAVLLGDYLLSKSLSIAVEHQDHDFLAIMANTAQTMSEGELLQIAQVHELATTEATYLEIIYKKTAILIAACCAIGALSAHAATKQVDMMYKLGRQIGMAFQIQDDLLDYEGTGALGKATGMDIKEKKITLPLLYALQQATEEDRQRVLYIMRDHNQNPGKVQEVMALVRASGGIAYAQEKMYNYRTKALKLLATCLEPSPYKEALADLIHQTIG